MGSCTSSKRRETDFFGDSEPDNIEAWNQPNIPQIPFEIRIGNVKLKGVPYVKKVQFQDNASVLINIPDCIDTKLERKKGPNNIKWIFDNKVRVKLSEYELRKKFIYISVFQAAAIQIKVAQLKLNLFLIATGPYHQDFPIRYTNKSEGRVSIDVRISQVVDVKVETRIASVTLLEDRPGQTFKYTLKSISNTFKGVESQASYSEKISTYDSKQLEQNYRKSKSRQSIGEEVHKIVWNRQGAISHQCEMPIVTSSMLGSDISNASMQFLLWTIKAAAAYEQEPPAAILVGECYVSFNKLLNNEQTLVTRKGRQYETHTVHAKQKMWYHGKYIGDMELEVYIQIPHFHRQMIVYVRTEMGIVKASPVIITDNKKSQCQELQQLIQSKDKIQQDINQIASFQLLTSSPNDPSLKQARTKVQMELAKQLMKLETSRKESSIMYNYRSEEEILKAQQVFIDIGFRLLSIVEDEDTGFRNIAFRCLMALMRRGELSLAYMGFKPEEKALVKNNQMSKYLTEKFQTALKFQTFVYQILRNVLTFLDRKTLQENERVFVELFCAYSYFRVPEFRQRLLSIITKPDDPEIVEWRGTEYPLTEDVTKIGKKQSNTFSLLFDWQSNFYDVIGEDDRCKQNLAELQQILDKQEWRHRMEKRGIGFFFFIIYWVKYVEKVAIISDNVKWQDLPGYPQLLKVILCQLKRRPIVDYPDSLVDASVNMLANEKLLNTFITILFNKTNIFDANMTLRTIELVNLYFKELDKGKRSIPTSFNYNFFVSGLKSIIMSEHSYAIAKCLLLYYDHYNMLNYFVRKDLNMFLLGKVFFRLFLNWSHNVRAIFHHLVMFRIYLQCNIVKKDKDSAAQQEYLDNEEFKRRYNLLLGILENAKDRKEQDQSMKFGYNYEKDYYKKMKKKIQNQRRMGVKNPHTAHSTDKSFSDPVKYSLVELVKAPNTRARSQAAIVKINYDKPPLGSQTDIANVVVKYHQPNQLDEKVHTTASTRQSLKRLTSHESDFEIAEINLNSLQYLSRSINEFRQAEDKYQKFYIKNNAIDPVPVVSVKVPIDEVELRPFHIDQW